MALNQQSRLRSVIGDSLRLFTEDATAWRLRVETAVAIAIAPIAVAGGVAVAHVSRPLYRFLTKEDSVLEWSQFACLVGAVVVLAMLAWRLARRRDWTWAAFFAIGAIVAFVIAGEEISWGQRIFGLATPDALQGVNTQGESNLHNVRGVLRTINFAWMIGSGLLTALPLAAALASLTWGRSLPWATAYRVIPPLALVPAFAIPFAYRFARFIRSGGTSGSFAEAVELCLYFGLLAFAFLVWRRVGAEADPAPTT